MTAVGLEVSQKEAGHSVLPLVQTKVPEGHKRLVRYKAFVLSYESIGNKAAGRKVSPERAKTKQRVSSFRKKKRGYRTWQIKTD